MTSVPPNVTQRPSETLLVSGIAPELACTGGLGPPRSELAIGALMPWAGRLWSINYLSSGRGSGTGCVLGEIDERLQRTVREEGIGVEGTFANRMVHFATSQLLLGPFLIDAQRRVRVVEGLLDYRLGGCMEHLHDPDNKCYVLGMEGHFLELDVHTLEVRQLFDLDQELAIPADAQTHFKAGFTAHGRVIVANNSFYQPEFRGERHAGRLAEWDGERWRVIDDNPYYEVHGRKRLGGVIYATGWDRASAILQALVPLPSGERVWRRYRLPRSSINFEHAWQTEWPRIRELEHERLLMDCHGMFYELSPHAWDGHVFGLKPVSCHLWAIPDFCSYKGLLVLGSDQTTPANGDNILGGEPDSGIWFGKTDDLWTFGRPSGWGGPWWRSPHGAGEASDPFLFNGFERKCLHLKNDGDGTVAYRIELDALGTGAWAPYQRSELAAGAATQHVFPDGLAAHWLRIVPEQEGVSTAQLYFS